MTTRKSSTRTSRLVSRRNERLAARVRECSRQIIWISGIAGTGKTHLLQYLGRVLPGRSRMRPLLLDDPDARAPALVKPGVGGRQLIVASRPTAPAAAVLCKGRLYGLTDVIGDDELFFRPGDFGAEFPAEAMESTGGWPVLVDAFVKGRAAQAIEQLPTFLQHEVLPELPSSLVATLFAALAGPLESAAVTELLGEDPRPFPLLRRTPRGLSLTSAWVAGALSQLLRLRPPHDAAVLQRVAEIHARFGKPEETIPTLLDMGQTEHALAVFERSGGAFFGYLHGFQALQTILERFGSELENRVDSLLFARISCLVKEGRPREGLLRLEARYPGLPLDMTHLQPSHKPYALLSRLSVTDESAPSDIVTSWSKLQMLFPPEDFLARGMVCNDMALAFLRANNLQHARRLSHEALDAYQRAGSPYLAHFMLVHLSDIALRQSRLRDAREHLEQAARLLSDSGLEFNTEPLVLDFFKAHLAYEEGRFEDCPVEIESTLQALLRGDSWPDLIVSMAAHLALVIFWRQGLRSALDAIEQCVLTLGRRHDVKPDRELALVRVRLYQIARRHAAAAERLEELDLEPTQRRLPHSEVDERFVRLRCAMDRQRGSAAATAEIAAVVKSLGQEPGLETRQKISLGILRATLHQRAGERALAKRQLTRALRAAETQGLVGVLVEEGEYLERLLPPVIADLGPGNDGLAVFAGRILKLLRSLPATTLHSKVAAGVSRQEHKVLTYLTDGYTNKEIARALVLSESTVKFHLRNLFRKLRVSSRRALIDSARRRGIGT